MAGVAAIITGLITLLVPILGWQLQLALFAVLAIVSTIVGRIFYKRSVLSEKKTSLNRRTDSYIGREVTLTNAIVNGVGSINIDKTRWRVVGPDTDANTKVVVKGLDGSSLVVEPIIK